MPLNKMIICLMAGAFSWGTLMIWHATYSSRLFVVDMKKLLNQPAVLLTKSSLSEKQQAQILQSYSSLLPQVLSEYGSLHHGTLIATPVVISGSQDITDLIMDQTLARLKHHV